MLVKGIIGLRWWYCMIIFTFNPISQHLFVVWGYNTHTHTTPQHPICDLTAPYLWCDGACRWCVCAWFGDASSFYSRVFVISWCNGVAHTPIIWFKCVQVCVTHRSQCVSVWFTHVNVYFTHNHVVTAGLWCVYFTSCVLCGVEPANGAMMSSKYVCTCMKVCVMMWFHTQYHTIMCVTWCITWCITWCVTHYHVWITLWYSDITCYNVLSHIISTWYCWYYWWYQWLSMILIINIQYWI